MWKYVENMRKYVVNMKKMWQARLVNQLAYNMQRFQYFSFGRQESEKSVENSMEIDYVESVHDQEDIASILEHELC